VRALLRTGGSGDKKLKLYEGHDLDLLNHLVTISGTNARHVAVVRGPNWTQYGSDSLGGTLNVLTRPAAVGARELDLHGDIQVFFASADLSLSLVSTHQAL
jgi:outer membrane receptor protein involved in Fe transport